MTRPGVFLSVNPVISARIGAFLRDMNFDILDDGGVAEGPAPHGWRPSLLVIGGSGMTGPDFPSSRRESFPGVPVLMLVRAHSPGLSLLARLAGADACLACPFGQATFRRAVTGLLFPPAP